MTQIRLASIPVRSSPGGPVRSNANRNGPEDDRNRTQHISPGDFLIFIVPFGCPRTSSELSPDALFKRILREFLFSRFILKHFASNLLLDMSFEAKRDTFEEIKANMADAPYCENHLALVRYAVADRSKEGLFAQDKHPKVPDNILFQLGYFNATLPRFLNTYEEPVAFLHVDYDLYSSTVTILEGLRPRLHPGAIVLFDEYLDFHRWQQHGFKAFQEFVERTGVNYEYLPFSVRGQQVVVRIVKNARYESRE